MVAGNHAGYILAIMVARKKAQKKARKNGRVNTRNPAITAAFAKMDEGAMAYRRLLLDPCNAPLCASVFAGFGTGIYRRYRSFFAPGGSNVEGIFVFQLGTNSYYHAGHVAATAGQNYTYGTAVRMHDAADMSEANFRGSRCLAGCVKVRYIGAEGDRQGLVALTATPNAHMNPGAVSSIGSDLGASATVSRVGEIQHEVKFVPGAKDEEFANHNHGIAHFDSERGCVMVVYKGIQPGSLLFEVTSVHEHEVSSRSPYAAVPPPSNVTLNTLLRSLGPVINWAYGNVSAPVMKSFAGGAVRTLARHIASTSAAVPLITL